MRQRLRQLLGIVLMIAVLGSMLAVPAAAETPTTNWTDAGNCDTTW